MNRTKRVSGKLTSEIIIRFFAAVFIYSGLFFGALILGYFVCRNIIWQGTEPLYYLLSFIRDWLPLFFIIGWLGGIVGIFIYYWHKTLSYIDRIVEAGNWLVSKSDTPIDLPPELAAIESQMNEIKQKALKNEKAAKEAESRKNDLIVYLAHDLKTPLTSVIGYLTLLKDEPEISRELQEKYMGVALDKAERLEELINEFFEITRFNLTHITLELSRVNLSRMLEQITYEFKPMFESKGLSCRLSVEPNMIFYLDVDKMERVFDNLFRNAVNYSFPDTEIRVTGQRKQDGVEVIFQNKGNTIPGEKLNRIFEQFFRLDSSRTSGTGGAGLGLAIAKEIVELHGGAITAASADENITFIVFLPEEKGGSHV